MTSSFHSGQFVCRMCGNDYLVRQHHVVYQQKIKAVAASAWGRGLDIEEVTRRGHLLRDSRNALSLCDKCHELHHKRVDRYIVPLSALRDENYEFAFELLSVAAYDYLKAHYRGTDIRVDRILLAGAEGGGPTQ